MKLGLRGLDLRQLGGRARRRTPGHEGAHAAASCRGSGKGHPPGALGMDSTSARARVLPPKNGVGHGHGADPQLPRRAQHRRRRPEAPRRRACSAPPSTATSSRSSQPADSLRVAQEPATGTAHVRNSNGKASDNKSNARPKKQRKPPMRPQARAALLTMLPRGLVDLKGRPGRVIPLRGGLGHARVSIFKNI